MLSLAKRILKLLLLLIGIFLLLYFALMLYMPQLGRCLTIDTDRMFMQREGVYMSIDTPKWVQDSLLSKIHKAGLRNQAFWGEKKSQPTWIYCYKKWLYDQYGVRGKPASTWLSLAGSHIVLSGSAINLNIISHELCHAELLAHLGWFNRDKKIPTWFDEGLAMQLDHRERYAERHYQRFGESKTPIPALNLMTTPAAFWEGSKEETRKKYIAAKHELMTWLGDKPRRKLLHFIQLLQDGAEFDDAYKHASVALTH